MLKLEVTLAISIKAYVVDCKQNIVDILDKLINNSDLFYVLNIQGAEIIIYIIWRDKYEVRI